MSKKRVHLASGGRLTGAMRRLKSGSPQWAVDNTSTVPYDPAQEITRAKDADKKIAPSVSTPAVAPPSQQTTEGGQAKEQTQIDGTIEIKTTKPKYIPGAPGRSAAKMGNDVAIQARQAYFQQHGTYPPCINSDCRSYGLPHDNCLCYGTTSDAGTFMAKGGVIKERFCSKKQMHHPKCEYYAEGGPVEEAPPVTQAPDNTGETIGHSAIEHGLLGLLKDVGQRKIINPEKHVQKLQESMMNPDREKMSESLNGHPLTGMVSSRKLKPIMDRLDVPVKTKEANPDSFRNSVDYLSSAVRGHNALDHHADEMYGSKDFSSKLEPGDTEDLKNHLEDLQVNPSKMLEVGGSLGHYLPEHSADVAAHSARAVNYLQSLKPTRSQNGPLDAMSPIDKQAESKYHRALGIAQQPLMAMYYAKEGSLQPQDVISLKTMYPGLYKSMVSKVGERLIDAKADNTEIPYKQRLSVSLLIGQPLDSTMTPMAMQAIMNANAGAQTPQSNPDKGPKKASGVELKQINKVNELYETPLQRRQMDRKS